MLFKSVDVVVNESIGSGHLLKISTYLHDGSRLEIMDAVDSKGDHK